MSDPLLLTPGPTLVPPEIRQALGQPMLHHRTPEFQKILKEAEGGLKKLFGTSQEVFILTSSGTGAMEAAVVNLLSSGDEAIVIRGGKFGERWGEICESYGVRVIAVDPPWGKPLDPAAFAKVLGQHPGAKAVFATLCETSTGVTFDIRGIRKAMGESAALLVVDTISGLGAEPFSMDAWGVDVTVCGSQKGLMLPPGLAFIALSPRAWKAAENARLPKYYFNLTLAREAWADTDTPFTPAISLIVGLVASLKRMEKIGLENLLQMHRKNAEAVRQALKALGMDLYPDQSCASNAVTMVKVPAGIDGKELLKKLRNEYGIVMAGGQGKELAGKVIRIATMGAVGAAEIRIGLAALEKVLESMGWKSSSPGVGVETLEAALK